MIKHIFRWFENRIDPYPDNLKAPLDGGLKAFLWAGTEGMRGWLLLLTLLTVSIGIFEALLYAWMGDIVDWINTYGIEAFWQQKQSSLMFMVAVMVLSPLLVFLNSATHFQTLQGVFPMRLRWLFHKLMLGQSMQFFSDEMSGRVSAKVMQTSLAVRQVVMTFADMLTYIGVYLISTGVILASFDGWLLVPFLSWVVLYVLMMWYFIPRLGESARVQADARSLMTGRVTDAYANITTVKLFSHARREQTYAREAMDEFLSTVHVQMRYVTGFEVVNHIINTALVGATAALGLYLWQVDGGSDGSGGAVTVGAIAASTALALRVNGLSHWIMWQVATLFENLGTVQDGMKTFAKKHTVVDAPDAKILEVSAGKVDFEVVNFAYNAHNVVFNDFTLNIAAGEKIGLVGRSGAGKSTLVNLLLRFYDADSGSICIDGQNLKDVTQESLREHIGMVTQDTSLLHRSIRDNIAYGKPDASDAEITEAAKQAHAYEFIQSLTDKRGKSGFDTLVGERGVKLSGGQRQRIAIARVMLKNAPILLLDEATSALDSEIEKAINDSLENLMAGKTVIAIAHRLSTIAAMDRLVVVDDGRIVEQGTHDELLAKNGLYAKLWTHQSGGFLAESID